MDDTLKVEMDLLPEIKDVPLLELLGCGVFGKVYKSKDPGTNIVAAAKVQNFDSKSMKYVVEEYRVLKDLCNHPNLPEFYGAYRATDEHDQKQLYFFMELCEGGPVIDLVKSLIKANRRMFEEHIAFILKETIKALNYLHGHLISHGDVKCSNILLTTRGEVKLTDFNLSHCYVNDREAKPKSRIGSPCWMAPEIISGGKNPYGNRADVWSLAITAIELGDGAAPYEDMHPTRAIFQIERNPPATLYRPHIWSSTYNDFIAECLIKNPEHRPLMMEIVAHPFITQLPQRDYHLNLELAKLLEDFRESKNINRKPEVLLDGDSFQTGNNTARQKMLVEDLATLEEISDENILQLLHQRFDQGHLYTFVGDILVALSPEDDFRNLFDDEAHARYKFKAISDNAPHVFAIADNAYQNMLHYREDQKILISGETSSGKTMNAMKVIEHLIYMGKTDRNTGDLIQSSLEVLSLLSHAQTPQNKNSTRCIFQTKLTYNITGNISGAIFSLYQLEKWRVSEDHIENRNHHNFHIFHYFYDGMEALGKLHLYNLENDTKYRFLKIAEDDISNTNKTDNIKKFMTFVNNLRKLAFEDEELSTIWNILSAILLIGEISYEDDNEVSEYIRKISENLNIDECDLNTSLTCLKFIDNDVEKERKRTATEFPKNCDTIASTLYKRLIDWIVNTINDKFSLHRALYGDSLSICILDMFGFESYQTNKYEQLIVNTLNEQMQYFYNHIVFVRELQEFEEEHIQIMKSGYPDNGMILDELLGNSEGLWSTIDEAAKAGRDSKFILDVLEKQNMRSIRKVSEKSFTIAHYAGKVEYHIDDLASRVTDNIEEGIIELLISSSNDILRQMFASKLSETGCLVPDERSDDDDEKSDWERALLYEKYRMKKNLSVSKGLYTQSSGLPNSIKFVRSTALKLLKDYSIDTGTGNIHFIRCIRRKLKNGIDFDRNLVKQQILAMSLKSTAFIRKDGFPFRISFQEFLRRYKFMAFDFDEKVELNKQNCRLLLLRLKIEGWLLGRTKVFLKYYNLEYLCRLYEYQMKKIVKVQSLVRSFLSRKLLVLRSGRNDADKSHQILDENILDEESKLSKCNYANILYYWKLWRKHTIFEILLKYKAARQQDLICFSQQVHIFNQIALSSIKENNECVPLEEITQENPDLMTETFPVITKLPFRLNQLTFLDSMSFYNSWDQNNMLKIDKKFAMWDAPLRQTKSEITRDVIIALQKCNENLKIHEELRNSPFSRDTSILVGGQQQKYDKSGYDISTSVFDEKEVPTLKKPTVCKRNLVQTAPKKGESHLVQKKVENTISHDATLNYKSQGSNPIEELKLLGNAKKVSEFEDYGGPFNFQSLLRKTQHRRFSTSCDVLQENSLIITKTEDKKNDGDVSGSEI